MANQMFEIGTVIQPVGNMQLECTAVSYQETDGEKHDFAYTFQLKEEVDAAREAAAEAQRQEEERQAQLNNIENQEG